MIIELLIASWYVLSPFLLFVAIQKYHFHPCEVSINKLLSLPSNLIESRTIFSPLFYIFCSTLEVGRNSLLMLWLFCFWSFMMMIVISILRALTIIFNIATSMNASRLPFISTNVKSFQWWGNLTKLIDPWCCLSLANKTLVYTNAFGGIKSIVS